MKVYINNSEVDKSLITVNTGLNYGRFNYEELVIDTYKIIIPIQEFIDAIEPDYNSIRDEIKMDDEKLNETSVFTNINYGSMTVLLKDRKALQEITFTYLDSILFSKLFSQTIHPNYIINSTDLVEVFEDAIEISGRSFRKQ